MEYILVNIAGEGDMYQEVYNGAVLRYVYLDGSEAFTMPPVGSLCTMLDPKPQQPAWGLPDPQPVSQPHFTQLSKVDYMNRFTEEELAGIYSAAKQYVAVEVWLEKFRLSEFIDLSDPRTIAGIQALEAAGLLAAGRAQEILNA